MKRVVIFLIALQLIFFQYVQCFGAGKELINVEEANAVKVEKVEALNNLNVRIGKNDIITNNVYNDKGTDATAGYSVMSRDIVANGITATTAGNVGIITIYTTPEVVQKLIAETNKEPEKNTTEKK